MAAASSSAPMNSEMALAYWCHECDMSIHLLFSAAGAGLGSLLCPQCQVDVLELMDDLTPASELDFELLHLDSPTFRSTFPEGIPRSCIDMVEEPDGGTSLFLQLTSVMIGDADRDDGVEEPLPCGVCKDHFTSGEEAKKLPCRHMFHTACIFPWLSSDHDSCPLCRFQLTTINVQPRGDEV